MALFGNKKITAEPTEPVVTPVTPAPSGVTTESLVSAMVQAMQQGGLINTPTVKTDSVESDDDDQPDPREEARIGRAVNQRLAVLAPYMETFETAMPELVRDRVVSKLKPGQRMIYEKYEHEVDALMSKHLKGNPAARANPETHRRAISMVLGDHSDEIESLSLQHATAEDVPHLVVPSQAQTATEAMPALNTIETQYVAGFNMYAKAHETWDAKSWDYYKNIPKGFLHEMVAKHRANKRATTP